MSAELPMDYVFTPHARYEMERRGLSEELIRQVLEGPGQRWEVQPGRHLVQAMLPMGDPPKACVIRVIIDVDRNPNEVVTAYRSSKIQKHWRKE